MWDGWVFWGLHISSLYIHSALSRPGKFDRRTLSAWLCLLLAEVFSASSLYWETRFDWEKELNPHFRGVGRKKPEKLQTLPRVGCQRGNGPGSQQLAWFSSCLKMSGGETLCCVLGTHWSCSAVIALRREKAEGKELKFPVVVSINICTQTCFMLVKLISLLPSFKWSV